MKEEAASIMAQAENELAASNHKSELMDVVGPQFEVIFRLIWLPTDHRYV